MAITFDAKSRGVPVAASGSMTYQHTCTGSNLVLFVFVQINNNDDLVSGVTYNGDALTLAKRYVDATRDKVLDLWYKVGPDTGGAYDVVVTIDGTEDFSSEAASFAGFTGFYQDDTKVAAGASGTAISIGITPGVDNELLLAHFDHDDSAVSTIGSGTELYTTDDGTYNTGEAYIIQTSKGLGT
jgi:hypothetical protein